MYLSTNARTTIRVPLASSCREMRHVKRPNGEIVGRREPVELAVVASSVGLT
jgi:hypothetical protein